MTSKRYASVFDAIADAPQEAVNPGLRAEVMQRLARVRHACESHP